MESMFAPTSASVRATIPNARAVIGRPNTSTTCVDRRRAPGSSPVSIDVCTCMPMPAMACSTTSRSASGSPCTATRALSVRWPRTTTCSTSSRSTPWRVSASNSTELTPGRSGPVTVTRTFVPRRRCVSVIRYGSAWRGSARLRVAVRLGLLTCTLRGDLEGRRLAADVRLVPEPLDVLRVVQLERRALGADPRQLGEVVPRRRARGGPLQRVPEAPGVVDGDHPAVPVALEHVPQERQRRGTEDERADRGDRVQRGEAVGGQVGDVAARHALRAQPVLYQEGEVEPDEGH